MASLSVRLKAKAKRNPLIHDLRLYPPKQLPKYINPYKTKENIVLSSLGPLPRSQEEADDFLAKLEQENRELFRQLKEQGLVPRNQGYKLNTPIVSGILTLSHEAQETLEGDGDLFNLFISKAKEYLRLLADALGTDLIYAVVHLDETAPHIHFALRNLRYRPPSQEASEKLGLDGDAEALRQGIGKAVSNTFYGDSPKGKNPRPYQLPYSRLQDTLNFFRPLGFGRGKPKKKRIADGEPVWKWVNRSVRQLHEDLPKEINRLEIERSYVILKLLDERERLEQLQKQLQELEERKRREEEELRKLREELHKLEDEIRKLEREKLWLEENIDRIMRKAEEEKLQLKHELAKQKFMFHESLKATAKRVRPILDFLNDLMHELERRGIDTSELIEQINRRKSHKPPEPPSDYFGPSR